MAIIYKHTFKTSHNTYIGQTIKTLEKRLMEHNASALRGSLTDFAKEIRKYGIDDIESSILYTTENLYSNLDTKLTNLDIQEIFFIKKYNTLKHGLNMNEGGGSQMGYTHTENSKEKMSISAKKNLVNGKKKKETIEKEKKQKEIIGTDGLNSWQRAGKKSAETLGAKGLKERMEKARQTALENNSYERVGKINSEKAKVIEENGETMGHNKSVKGHNTRKENGNYESAKKKMSETMRNKPRISCPHCDKVGSQSNMKRWHFDNCKKLITLKHK